MLVLMLIIIFTACASKTDSRDISHDIPAGLDSPDDMVFCAEFDEIFEEFKQLVKEREYHAFLERFVDENTASSLDPHHPTGAEEFIEFWSLNYFNPANSEVWTVLDEIIELGGRLNAEKNIFRAPFILFGDPDIFNNAKGDFTFIVNGKDVNLYEENDLDSKIIAKLGYNAICYLSGQGEWFSDNTEADLVRVRMPDGAEGYIQKGYLKSLIDWRLEMHKTEEGWKLKYLVSAMDNY